MTILDLVCAPAWRVLDVPSGLPRIAELLRKYADRPMDFADASLGWAAEQSAARDWSRLRRRRGVADERKRGEASNRQAETGKLPQATARAVQQPSNGAARVCGRCSQQAP
ncbi:MAG: hypothetical protein HY017_26380 [Betaproteobacteria bacterium]|nr:hypothetical protein [Betaproteobacteria bacterium]